MRPIHFATLDDGAKFELRSQVEATGHGTIVVAGDEVHVCNLGDACVYAGTDQ